MKIGVTVGSFDLCHAGHILMLKDSKSQCDWLIVGIQSDPSNTEDSKYRSETGGPKNKPIMSIEERRIILEGIKYVDEIFVYANEEELYEKFKALKYDVRILGSDWENKNYTGSDLPHNPYFHRRNHGYSSSSLRKRVYEAEKSKEYHA